MELGDLQLPGTRALSKPERTFPGCLDHNRQILFADSLQNHSLTSVHQTTQRREQSNARCFLVTQQALEAMLAGKLSTLGRNGRLSRKNSHHDVTRNREYIIQTKINYRRETRSSNKRKIS